MNRADYLEKALSLTTGDRDKIYGDPFHNHTKLAQLITAFLGVQVTAPQAAIIMVLAKISRIAVSPLHDANYVDGSAYMAIAGECAHRLASIKGQK